MEEKWKRKGREREGKWMITGREKEDKGKRKEEERRRIKGREKGR